MFNPFQKSDDLIVHSKAPFNAEPPLARLREAFVTPQSLLYVRSHGNIPTVDAASHRISVEGLVSQPFSFSVDELKHRFAARTVSAVMQCAGNRRADMRLVRPVSGDPWAGGAIGHAAWTGVPLCDVLRAAGCRDDETLHVAFEALDIAETAKGKAPYGVSIPLQKALTSDVLLATAMNGEDLAPEHGFPLRVVVPGFAGVRSPKWLARIVVQDTPSDAFQQAQDYKLFPPDMREETQNLARGITIDEMPLNSAICVPSPGATMRAGKVEVRGYATATDRAVTRVDLSADGGRSWCQAEIEPHDASRWSWILWNATLDLPPGEHELAVRAWDAAGQTQPALPDDTWNFKGYLSAAWHRIHVTAE